MAAPTDKTGRLEYSYHDQSGYYPCSEMLEVNWLAGAYSNILICLKFLVLLETPLRDFFLEFSARLESKMRRIFKEKGGLNCRPMIPDAFK